MKLFYQGFTYLEYVQQFNIYMLCHMLKTQQATLG